MTSLTWARRRRSLGEFWRIFRRMGLPPWLSVMASVPLVNLIVLYYVAMTPWPAAVTWSAGGSPGRNDGPDARF